jgi:hypothetical protein
MASSSTVSTGDVATAAQYNNLRIDVLDTSSGHSHTGTDSKDLGTLTADLTISQSGASQIEVISTAADAYLILNSDTDEGQDSEIIFEAGGTAKGRIEYSHHATANTQVMSFFTADNAVETLKLQGNLATFATAVDLGSNTLTSTGSMQIRTIDYSDGDLAMTIADGGGVTFAGTASSLTHPAAVVDIKPSFTGTSGSSTGIQLHPTFTDANSDVHFGTHIKYTYADTGTSQTQPSARAVWLEDSAVTGTGNVVTNMFGLWIDNFNSGDSSSGTSLYIEGGGTYALHVDAGKSRFDGNVYAADMLIVGNGTTTVPTETGSAMTHGILIDMGNVDDDAFQIRNSDVAHGVTDVKATDVFFAIRKAGGTAGGAMLEGFRDANQDAGYAFLVRGTLAEAADTSESAGESCLGVVQMDAAVKSTNARGAVAADGNAFVVSNNLIPEFIVKGDGELYSNQSATVATFDSYDDAQLIRTLDHARKPSTMINDKWDEFIKYNEQDLINARILGDTVENGGMINVTGLQRLHNGAIWQGYTRQMELQEEVNELKTRLLALEGGK